MKNLDLEKVIILLSLVLMPVVGFWVYSKHNELAEAERGLAQLRGNNGPQVQFHQVVKQIIQTRNSLKEQAASDPTLYFRNRFQSSFKPGTRMPLKLEELTINQRSGGGVIKMKSKPVASLIPVDIRVGRGRGNDRVALSRDAINAFVVNSESATPLWRMQRIKLTNKDYANLPRGSKIPPMIAADQWYVDNLLFARIKPIQSNKKK